MESKALKKEVFCNFINKIIRGCDLIAPVKTDEIRFQKITSSSQIYLDKNSYFPLKELFFKKGEPIFNYSNNTLSAPKKKIRKKIIFGIRRCDLNSIARQDIAFSERTKDAYYFIEREHSFLIGYHCNQPEDKYCFCGSMGLKDYFDLMFYDKGSYFLVEIGTEKGAAFIAKNSQFFSDIAKTSPNGNNSVENADRLKKSDISGLYCHSGWKEGVELCLSCAACNLLCPTCYCFEFQDHANIPNLSSGNRVRNWSACQLKDFTRVAGSHVFRNEREHRFKHRIYHQLQYFKERHGVSLCTGCGRCIRGCPSRIDFVDIINRM